MTSYLEQLSRQFCQHFMQRTTQQTLLTINLVSQQKTTKLYFSSQATKEFKLLMVPLKPLRCCLRSDQLVNCFVWKFCKDLFLNFRVVWFINQIVLFNGFLSDFVNFFSSLISVNSGFRNIYLATLRLGKYIQPLFTAMEKNNIVLASTHEVISTKSERKPLLLIIILWTSAYTLYDFIPFFTSFILSVRCACVGAHAPS